MNPTTIIRPPWPDELARLAQAFPDLQISRPCRPLVLVATEPYERLVGAALVSLPPTEASQRTCELAWQVRPRFVDDEVRLLRAAAATLPPGESLVWQERTADGVTGSPAPKSAGFACTQVHEVWGIPLANCLARRAPYSAALQHKAAAAGYTAGPAQPAYHDGIVGLVTAAGLLTAERVRFTDEHPAGYDREISTVVLRNNAVMGAVLVRRDHQRAIVETRVVAPGYLGRFNLPNALLLDRSLQVAAEAGLTEAVLTADPSSAPETIRFAKKCNGQRRSTVRLWRCQAAA